MEKDDKMLKRSANGVQSTHWLVNHSKLALFAGDLDICYTSFTSTLFNNVRFLKLTTLSSMVMASFMLMSSLAEV